MAWVENIQATTTAKVGLTNSEGCSDRPPRLIQRAAPLISWPDSRVAAISPTAMMKPTQARRRTVLGDSSETPNMVSSAGGTKTNWRRMKWKCSAPMRSATAGLAAMISNAPITTSSASATMLQRSTVHHQRPMTERSVRPSVIMPRSFRPPGN